jgi:hypothetical protein
MSKRASLNERRLTKKQVAQLLADGAVPRPDLDAGLAAARIDDMRCYELPDNRILWVFQDTFSNLDGKGDIYPLDYCVRFIQWARRVNTDARAGARQLGIALAPLLEVARVASRPRRIAHRGMGAHRLGGSSTLAHQLRRLDSASDAHRLLGVERAASE